MDSLEQVKSVSAHLHGQLGALVLALGKPIRVGSGAIPLHPFGINVSGQPVRAAADSASRAARSVSVRNSKRFTARTAASTWVESVRCRPPALTTPSSASRASSRSRTLSSSPRVDKPLSEPSQHRMIESRISEFQAQGVLPVDPTPYGVSSLPIGQILGELQNRN